MVPPSLVGAVFCGGAELVIESAEGEASGRTFVHILDEFERRKKLEAPDLGEPLRRIHQRRLRDLTWARSTVWEDTRMQRYLTSSDPCLWPNSETLRRTAELIRQLKQFADQPPDTRGGDALLRAVDVIEAEGKTPGVHPLKPAPVSGVLTPYRVRSWIEPFREGYSALPNHLERCPALPTEAVALQLEVTASAPLMASEVARLPQTATTSAKLVGLCASPRTGTPSGTPASQWQTLVSLHRARVACGAVGLMTDVQEALKVFGMEEEALAYHMQDAAAAEARVRLRVGVYATIIHRHRVCVVLGADPKTPLTAEELSQFASVSGVTVVEASHAGELICVPRNQSLSDVLRGQFLSPVLSQDAIEVCCTVGQPAHLSSTTTLYIVTTPFNPFLILHGCRVSGGFNGRTEVFESFKRQRDEVAEDQTELALRNAYQRSLRGGNENISADTVVSGTTESGDDVRLGVGRAVIKVLTGQPTTKSDLAAHAALAQWRHLPQFDQVLRAALKTHAEYHGRKYKLKEH